MSITPELYEFITKVVEDKVKEIRVTREDLDKLVSTVKELTQAQARSEERLTRLELAVEKLTQAQARSEERLTRLELAVEKLTQAQARTEEALANLVKSVAGLSETVGFGLEDLARSLLPTWLRLHEGIEVSELSRKFFKFDSREVEVNLYGEGRDKTGTAIIVLGEAKARFYSRDVEQFAAGVRELVEGPLKTVNTYSLVFGFWIHPLAENVCHAHDIRPIASYMLSRK